MEKKLKFYCLLFDEITEIIRNYWEIYYQKHFLIAKKSKQGNNFIAEIAYLRYGVVRLT